jgi:hypothetical protein
MRSFVKTTSLLGLVLALEEVLLKLELPFHLRLHHFFHLEDPTLTQIFWTRFVPACVGIPAPLIFNFANKLSGYI